MGVGTIKGSIFKERLVKVSVNNQIFRQHVLGLLPRGIASSAQEVFVAYFREATRLETCLQMDTVNRNLLSNFLTAENTAVETVEGENGSQANFEKGVTQFLLNNRSDALKDSIPAYFAQTLQLASSLQQIELLRERVRDQLTRSQITPSDTLQKMLAHNDELIQQQQQSETVYSDDFLATLSPAIPNSGEELSSEEKTRQEKERIDGLFIYRGNRKQLMDIAVILAFTETDDLSVN